MLPLDLDTLGTIAVIGPNANRSLLGGYSGVPAHDVTVLEGITARVGDQRERRLRRGVQDHRSAARGPRTTVTPSDPDEDRRQIAEAVEVASRART